MIFISLISLLILRISLISALDACKKNLCNLDTINTDGACYLYNVNGKEQHFCKCCSVSFRYYDAEHNVCKLCPCSDGGTEKCLSGGNFTIFYDDGEKAVETGYSCQCKWLYSGKHCDQIVPLGLLIGLCVATALLLIFLVSCCVACTSRPRSQTEYISSPPMIPMEEPPAGVTVTKPYSFPQVVLREGTGYSLPPSTSSRPERTAKVFQNGGYVNDEYGQLETRQ